VKEVRWDKFEEKCPDFGKNRYFWWLDVTRTRRNHPVMVKIDIFGGWGR